MTVAGLIQLFDVKDLPMRGLHEIEVTLYNRHQHQRGLLEVDQALYWAVRAERLHRQHTAITVPVSGDRR